MRNPANKEGPFLEPPRQSLTTKSATGITRVTNGGRPLTHGDSPLTMATDKSNWGVSTNGPKPSAPRSDGPDTTLPAQRGRTAVRDS